MELPFKLETQLEERIAKDKVWIEGVLWGVPRKGHPEGKVVLHIKEVLDNIDKLRIDEKTRRKLRIIALIHDTLKYKSDTDKSIHVENKHAVFARRFAEKYTKDEDILKIIELHDEAYFSWKLGKYKNNWIAARERAIKLIKNLSNKLQLYLYFYECDNKTGNKTQDSFEWFKKLVEECAGKSF